MRSASSSPSIKSGGQSGSKRESTARSSSSNLAKGTAKVQDVATPSTLSICTEWEYQQNDAANATKKGKGFVVGNGKDRKSSGYDSSSLGSSNDLMDAVEVSSLLTQQY